MGRLAHEWRVGPRFRESSPWTNELAVPAIAEVASDHAAGGAAVSQDFADFASTGATLD